MSGKKNIIFFFAMLVMVAGISILLSSPVLKWLDRKLAVKSDYEANLKAEGMDIADLRARAPYVMFRPKPGPGGINSLGFHSPEIAKDKKNNEYRVAMTGGSVVFNGGQDSSSIVYYLTETLKAHVPELKDKEVTFINGGIPSAVSGQELAQLIYHLLPLKIDLLVVLDGYNDFYVPFYFDRRPGYPYDYIVEEYRYYKFVSKKDSWQTGIKLIANALLKKNPGAIVTDYYRELGIQRPTIDEGIAREFEIYFQNIEYMTTIANAFGIKVAVFLQSYCPKRNVAIPDRPETGALLRLYGMAQKKFELLAKGNSPDKIYADLVPMGFDQLRDKFTDHVHFNDTGLKLVANEMYAVMKKEGMLK